MSKSIETFTATIWLGLRERYSGRVHHTEEVRTWLKTYCNTTGFCVSLEEVEFIYTYSPTSSCAGYEPGCKIGIINYPRFPSSQTQLTDRAVAIGQAFLKLCNQGKVSIVMPQETIMLESEDVQD